MTDPNPNWPPLYGSSLADDGYCSQCRKNDYTGEDGLCDACRGGLMHYHCDDCGAEWTAISILGAVVPCIACGLLAIVETPVIL